MDGALEVFRRISTEAQMEKGIRPYGWRYEIADSLSQDVGTEMARAALAHDAESHTMERRYTNLVEGIDFVLHKRGITSMDQAFIDTRKVVAVTAKATEWNQQVFEAELQDYYLVDVQFIEVMQRLKADPSNVRLRKDVVNLKRQGKRLIEGLYRNHLNKEAKKKILSDEELFNKFNQELEEIALADKGMLKLVLFID